MDSGIYEIYCWKTNRVYGGRTVSLETRGQQHFCQLTKGRHCNDFLQEDFKSFGKEAFEYRIIERCLPEELVQKEQAWLDVHWDANLPLEQRKCYNLENKSQPVSEETRVKMSKAQIGKKCPEVSAALRKRTGTNHPLFGKDRPWLQERNRRAEVIARVRETLKEQCKPVALLDLATGITQTFDSIYQASKNTKWCKQDIGKFLNGKRKQPKGYIFSCVR